MSPLVRVLILWAPLHREKKVNNLSDPLTVVIIEDEQAIADTLVHVLEMDGYQAVWFATAGEGLAFLQQNSAALLVLDVGLPIVNTCLNQSFSNICTRHT